MRALKPSYVTLVAKYLQGYRFDMRGIFSQFSFNER